MSANLILFVGAIYAYIAFDQGFIKNNLPMLVTYGAYAISNVGLYMMATK